MTKREEVLIERANARLSRIIITESENEGELAIVRPPLGNVFSLKKDPSRIGIIVVVLVALMGLSAFLGNYVSRFLQLSLPASYALICCVVIVFIGVVVSMYWRRSYLPMRLRIKKNEEYRAWFYSRESDKPDFVGDRGQLRMTAKEEWKTGWIMLTISDEDEGELAIYWISHNDLTRVKEFCRKYNPICFYDDFMEEKLAELHKEESGDNNDDDEEVEKSED